MSDRKRLVITDDDMGTGAPAPASPPPPPAYPPQGSPQPGPPAHAAAPPAAPMAPPSGAPARPAGPQSPGAPGALPPLPPPAPRHDLGGAHGAPAPSGGPITPRPPAGVVPPPPGYPPQGPGPGQAPGGWQGGPPPGHAPAAGYPLADLGSRVLAYIVDSLVTSVAFFVAIIAVALLAFIGGTIIGTVGVIIAYVIGLPLFVAAIYYAWAKPLTRPGANHGQTYGMQVTGVRLLRENGQPFTNGAAAFYVFVPTLVLSVILVGGLLNTIWPLIDGRRQSLRDKLAKTVAIGA